MSNLFKNLKPSVTLHRNGFDLSQRHLFTQSAGEVLPSMVVDCVPGDKIEIRKSSFCRTMPLNTAAFTRVKWFHHFFFVPYSILWQNWDSFITQRKNDYSSQANGSMYVPYFNVLEVRDIIGGVRDLYGYDVHDQRMPKLLDMLGYGNFYDGDFSASDAINVNVFRLAAYNKIWYDYYRNPYYDEGITSQYDYTPTWNMDDVVCTSVVNANIMSGQARANNLVAANMFSVKYRQWKKDLLTSLLPNTQYGAVSFVSVGGDINDPFYLKERHPNGSFSNPYVLLNSDSRTGVFSDVGVGSAAVQSPSEFYAQNLGFDVLTLRKAEYLQKWKESTMRAGQQALAQYEAHFGVKPRHSIDHTAHFLGGFDQTVTIDEVVTTMNDIRNGTSTSVGAGEIFGKGLSVDSSDKLIFDSTEFGVLMCCSSFVPEADYSAYGCDKNNILFEPFDFFTPEFQNLGMEPVTFQEFKNDGYLQDRNTVVGYAPRYWQYKTAKDKIHAGFIDTNNSGLESWVSPRLDFSLWSQGLTKASIYINPACLNSIFSQAYDGSVRTDQFLCNDFFDIKAIRPMSVLGLPTF